MLRLTLKNLIANRVRFALTTFGVILAVAFVVSAFVLGDGLRSTFGDLSEEIGAGTDLEVEYDGEFGEGEFFPAGTQDLIASVDGVADVVPSIEAVAETFRPINAEGEGISTIGPPQLAFGWVDNPQLANFTIVEGTSPVGDSQFVMDLDAAADNDFFVGETYDVITPSGTHQLELSGLARFGAENETGGAILMAVDSAVALNMFALDGYDNFIVEFADNADPVAVQAAVTAAIPDAEVFTNDEVIQNQKDDFNEGIDIVGNILLGFGGVSLFVSIFIIYNTFAIVLSQRTRELALLRTIGASPRQIKQSVLGESFVIGLIASVGGIFAGIGVARGLGALFGAIGADLPPWPTIVSSRTIIASFVIGLGVTMAAAIGPARKASSIPPIEALRGGDEVGAVGSRTRIVSGFSLFTLGLVGGAVGLTGAGSTAVTIALLAVGAILIFLGVTLLSPMMVNSITRVLGWPMGKLAGVSGRLAQENASRNPRRTATTAAALMIGLALVSMALVVGQSIKSSLNDTIDETVQADYVILDQMEDFTFPVELSQSLQDSDLISASTTFSYIDAVVLGSGVDANTEEVEGIVALDFAQIDVLFDFGVVEGSFATDVANPIGVGLNEATEAGLSLGDTVTTLFVGGETVETTVAVIFDDDAILDEDYVYSRQTLNDAGLATPTTWLTFALSDTASNTDIQAMVDEISSAFPTSDVQTADEFRESLAGSVDQLLAMINVMVALAVIIALIGIANTLALSVFERTRELGLLRAVGMTRTQLRRMVRFEAALVALFGAVLGVAIGILFGWGVVSAMPAPFDGAFSIPVNRIVILMMISGLAGVLAAVLPARRAGKLNVLDAIAH